MDYNFLPEDDKLLRLKERDFVLSGGFKTSNAVTCKLKKISNPILILFYYNDTEKDILSNWFLASRHNTYQKGSKEDFSNRVNEKDLDFKFGSVNLSYEKKLEFDFLNVNLSHPFNWIKIDKNFYYPFVLFYYKTYPQISYEGEIENSVILHEFLNWRSEFTDSDEEKIKNKKKNDILFENNYYQSTTNSFEWKDKKFISLSKDKIYKITIN